MALSTTSIHDLSLSGLEQSDIRARDLDLTEKAACGISPSSEGYVIPYFNMHGKLLSFYRAKVFNQEIKYRQLKNTSNHVYFPPKFKEALDAAKARGDKYIIITEGEKKAASAVRNGFPALAFGGVDSWRNRILLLPQETEMSAYSYNKKLIGCKLPSGTHELPNVTMEPVAIGFDDIVAYAFSHGLTFIITYDTDSQESATGVRFEVQRAASTLGFELRNRGLPLKHIRQLILPNIEGADKTGLDDLFTLLPDGAQVFRELIQKCLAKRTAFPQHPNMQEQINKKLQSTKLTRRDAQGIGLSIITDLDSRGMRMHATEERELYYFENKTKRLIKVDLTFGENSVHTPFSKLVYVLYGVSMAVDMRIMKWVATQYTGEDPIEDVTPYRIIARHDMSPHSESCLRYQINDGQYVRVTSDQEKPFEILDNGVDSVLFEADLVEAVDAEELEKELTKRQEEPLSMWWADVLQEVRLKDHGRTAVILSLLYYISPWLQRWKGTQLPAELVIGEAGSGKSTLCELRLQILTGKPKLRNAPEDMKGWHASIVSTGGLHVTDNVQLTDKHLRQKLSDDICRLITEPEPSIEMRKYFTTADLMSMRVDSVFAFTSIIQPFTQSDLLQRSIKVELDKLAMDTENTGKVSYDSRWKQNQIERFGGRAAWIAHHLDVMHRFFVYMEEHWDSTYQAKHRLINLEQLLVLLAQMFGIEHAWIPDYLVSQTDEAVVEADWMFEGVVAFAQAARADADKLAVEIGISGAQAHLLNYSAKNIAEWCSQQDDYKECVVLTNSRRLGRYLSTHKAMVIQVAGLFDIGKRANKTMYEVRVENPEESLENPEKT